MNSLEPLALAFLAGLSLPLLWMIFNPYKCENKHCGYWTYNRRNMFHHVQQKHYHIDSYTHKES